MQMETASQADALAAESTSNTPANDGAELIPGEIRRPEENSIAPGQPIPITSEQREMENQSEVNPTETGEREQPPSNDKQENTTTASVLGFSSTMVKLHEAATLPCYQKCSGVVTWTTPDKEQDILAQCDQTSCQSKDGFLVSHDEYLKGNLSLTIITADFSKKSWYTCKCNGKGVCDVSLRLEPFSYPVHVQAGESLSLDLPIPDDVEVSVQKSDGSNTFRLCRIEGHKAKCESVYENRVSVSSSLRLKEVKNDDGGTYIIRDIKNDEVIGMYTVTVNGTSSKREAPVAVILAVVFGVMLVLAVLGIAVLLVKNQRLRKCLRRMENAQVSLQQVQQQEQQEEQREEEPDVIVHSPVMETDDGQAIIEQKKSQQDKAEEEEDDPLLETDSPVIPPSVTEEPPLSVPVLDSCSGYLPRVFE